MDRREKRLARLQAACAQIETETAAKARKYADVKETRRQDRSGAGDRQAVATAGDRAAGHRAAGDDPRRPRGISTCPRQQAPSSGITRPRRSRKTGFALDRRYVSTR